jgi:hypothetical protein
MQGVVHPRERLLERPHQLVHRALPQIEIGRGHALDLAQLGLGQRQEALVVLPEGLGGQGGERVAQGGLGPVQQGRPVGGGAPLGLELGQQAGALLPERRDARARDQPPGEQADDGAGDQSEQQCGWVHGLSGRAEERDVPGMQMGSGGGGAARKVRARRGPNNGPSSDRTRRVTRSRR